MNRRNFITNTGRLGTGLILAGGLSRSSVSAAEINVPTEKLEDTEIEVTAVEDLMREHGVLRRILFVYSDAAGKLRQEPAKSISGPLREAAELFRDFGENYHEKALEETFIFPAVLKTKGEASTYPDILIAQHKRGREITDYIIETTSGKRPFDIPRLVLLLEGMVRMYRSHTAREDTIVFPAWKDTLTFTQYDEMNDKFELIEQKEFGEDGFEKAVSKIADIEKQLGLFDLSQFTAPPLTKSA